MSILLAINEDNFLGILRQNFSKAGLDVIDANVFHRNYLLEVVEIEKPSILIIHDTYLPSEEVTQERRDREMLQIIEYLRTTYDTDLRIVYLCERDKKDPFLSNLVARNVLDIFHEQRISTVLFVEQIMNEPRFSNVSKFGVGMLDIEFTEDETDETDSHEEVKVFDDTAVGTSEKDKPTRKLLSKITDKTKSAVEAGVEWNIQRQENKKIQSIEKEEKKQQEQAKQEVAGGFVVGEQDELDEIIDLMPIPKEVYERTQVIGTVVIGIAGAKPHLGATHTAMTIASHLSSLGHSVALIELNVTEDFERIHSLYEGEKHFLRNQMMFEMSGIDHYKYRNNIQMGEIMSTYEYVVLDVGALDDSPVSDEFLRAHIRLVLVSPHEWKEHWIKTFVGDKDVENYQFILPMANEKLLEENERRFPELSFTASPVTPNPYDSNDQTELFVQSVLKHYLKEPKAKSSKFNKSIILTSLISVVVTTIVISLFLYI